jgi:hypothetical protein
VRTNIERSPDSNAAIALLDDGDLDSSARTKLATAQLAGATDEAESTTGVAEVASVLTLAQLAPGSRLVLRCRKDWRAASVSSIEDDCVRLNVASPSGHTYRVRRPHDSLLMLDGSIPVLGAREIEMFVEADRAAWRVALARYDARW